MRISIVVPTLNSAATLPMCLGSIAHQKFRDFELIVVDGPSTDDTQLIAKKYDARYYAYPGSVPDSRNFGFSKSSGEILVSIDSDMTISDGLLDEIARMDQSLGALIIPEKGSGKSLLSRCEALEKELTIGHEPMESARVFSREAFDSVGGYDPSLLFGEDRDMHERVSLKYKIGRTAGFAYHFQDHLSIPSLIRKSFNYGRSARAFFKKRKARGSPPPANRLLFFSRWRTLFSDPLLGICLIVLKAAEYSAFAAGYLVSFFMPLRQISSGDRK